MIPLKEWNNVLNNLSGLNLVASGVMIRDAPEMIVIKSSIKKGSNEKGVPQ